MPLPNFIKNIFGGGAKEIIDSVGTVIDNLTLSKEEKEQLRIKLIEATNSHVEKMAALAQSETDSYLKDVQDSRNANVRIQESDKASFWAKNTGYFLDVFIGLIWGSLTIFIAMKQLKLVTVQDADYTGILSLYATVSAMFMISVQWHRGSSKSSEEKTKQINTMINK